MNKKILPVFIVAIIAVVGLFILFSNNNKLAVAPEISLQLIDGRKLELQELKGKPLLVTFWATTCSTCVKEIPHLIKFYNEFESKELEIIAIAMPYDPPNRVVEISERENIPYPVALDIQGTAVKAFGNIEVTPTSFLIDANGKVIQQKSGEINIEKLRTKIKSLLKTSSTMIS